MESFQKWRVDQQRAMATFANNGYDDATLLTSMLDASQADFFNALSSSDSGSTAASG
jgi:hypothetical protein